MKIISALLAFFLTFSIMGQDKYWVFFTDKEGVSFDPYSYFDSKALERRLKHNIPLSHYSDFPVKEEYVQEVSSLADEVKVVSRWMNCMVINAQHQNIEKIKKYPLVKEVFATENSGSLAKLNEEKMTSSAPSRESLAISQLALMQGEKFEENDLSGKGVRVAIFDAGFPNVDELETFQHIFDRNGVIATYNFVRKKEDVYLSNAHGTMTMSCVGGKHFGRNLGMAPDAEFLLAKTEKGFSEKINEEEFWLAAAEWADKNGADIINSSLGYTYHRYFQKDMDGQTTMITKAANMAASKGILVINSAGNEGSGDWSIIGAPADADSVLAIGGLNPWTTVHSSFGSYGPSSDGRIKPNVVAPSTVAAQGKHEVTQVDGTSFSSPLTAGFAACVMEKYPNKTNMEIFQLIQKSGHLSPYYDYAHGYGVPQAGKIIAEIDLEPTFTVDTSGAQCKVYIEDDFFEKTHILIGLSDDYEGINQSSDRFDTFDKNPQTELIPYFYYHVTDYSGEKIDAFEVLKVNNQLIYQFPKSSAKGKTYRFHYKGYTKEIKF